MAVTVGRYIRSMRGSRDASWESRADACHWGPVLPPCLSFYIIGGSDSVSFASETCEVGRKFNFKFLPQGCRRWPDRADAGECEDAGRHHDFEDWGGRASRASITYQFIDKSLFSSSNIVLITVP